jgi:hypothetical protein
LDQNSLPIRKDDQSSKNPLWWQLRNFRAALLRHIHLLHELAFVGAGFFNPEDRSAFGSVKAKICFICDIIDGLLSRVNPLVDVTFGEGEKKIS